MSPEAGRDLLAELSNAVAAYLSTMEVTAECLDESYPEVGSRYRKRIQALQSRVSYDATPKEIRESAKAIQAELRDYANVAKRVRTERSVDMEREILALGDIIENLAERQAHFGRRLREFAAQVGKAMPVEAAGLHGVVDSMSHETAAMVGKMREQMVVLDQRLAGAASTDPVTGLINRRELERQIEARRFRCCYSSWKGLWENRFYKWPVLNWHRTFAIAIARPAGAIENSRCSSWVRINWRKRARRRCCRGSGDAIRSRTARAW
jgi:hypothetical protein